MARDKNPAARICINETGVNAINLFESGLMLGLRDSLASPALDSFMLFISRLGDHGAVFIALALVLLCFKTTRRQGAVLALALIIDLLVVNVALKPLISRIRPYDFSTEIIPFAVIPGDWSFPSGHTAAAFAAAVSMLPFGKKAFVPMLVFALCMGFSRVYLLMHYPSDVAAGAIIGALCGLAADFIFKKLLRRDIIMFKD